VLDRTARPGYCIHYSMLSSRGIHHVGLRVVDVEEAAQRWSIQFGLSVRERSAGRALLACAYEPYSLELLGAAAGDEGAFVAGAAEASSRPGADHTAYELAPGISLLDAADRLERAGVQQRREENALYTRDPDGHGIELVPFAPGDDRRPAIARSTSTLPGFHPRKLGHVNSLTGDIAQMTYFYREVLGMRITDRLGAEGVWLRTGSDHHVLALIDKGFAHLHHLAFELTDWGELRVALDHLAQHGRWLAWGPLRHGVGQNLSAYVRIPEEECFVELFSDMERLGPEHEPRDWPDNVHSSNTWGILPPRSYFRFDPVAVEAERRGLEALGRPLPPPEGSPLEVAAAIPGGDR